ncbi:MAG: efflux RND transporter periplasmic adaptor subunit [Gemmataceae bacterium]
MYRLVKWLVVLGILGGGGYAASTYGMKWWKNRNIPRFQVAKVTRGAVESVVNSTGTIKPVRSVIVGAFVSGPIKYVNVDYNAEVKKDQILAEVDDRLPMAAVDRDKATLDTQRAEKKRIEALLEQAIRNEARAKKLIQINKDYLSGTEMDQFVYNRKSLEAQLRLAEATITQAEATLKNSMANLAYTKIVSPVDGVIIERKVDPGQTVAASFQTPELFTVAPNMREKMHIYASVDEADIGLINNAREKSQPVNFTVDAYSQELFEGKVYQIRKSGTTTQNVVTYPVVIETPNPDLKLMPGMTANISFVVETKKDILRIPSAALRFTPPPLLIHPDDKGLLEGKATTTETEGGPKLSATQKVNLSKGRLKRIVWYQDGDKVRGIPVTIGLTDAQFAELIEGDVKEGQELITSLDTTSRN